MAEHYYIRFGDIPENEVSNIYKHGDKIGEEAGVSVYNAVCIDGNWRVVLPEIRQLRCEIGFDLYAFIENDRPVYLVSGDLVGTGTTNEPVIKNVKIIKRLK